MKHILQIDKTLQLPREEISLIGEFCNLCVDKLGLSCDFIVKIVEDKKKNKIKTTAYYDPDTHLICILGKGRHHLDICRSIAHEMTHMMQHERGLIAGPIKDIGGFHEDQANSRAGQIVKEFIYAHNL